MANTTNTVNLQTVGIAGNAGTTFVASPATQHAVQVGGSTTSTLTSLSVGATGTVLIGTTGADPSFSATPSVTGVTFPSASSSGSPTSDTLSFYEEGTFVPTILFGGVSTGVTYTAHLGWYTRVGRIVFINFNILLSSKGSAVGQAQVGGLPFNSGANGASFASCITYFSALTAANMVAPNINYNGTTSVAFFTYQTSGGGNVIMTDTNFANTTQILCEGWFFIV